MPTHSHFSSRDRMLLSGISEIWQHPRLQTPTVVSTPNHDMCEHRRIAAPSNLVTASVPGVQLGKTTRATTRHVACVIGAVHTHVITRTSRPFPHAPFLRRVFTGRIRACPYVSGAKWTQRHRQHIVVAASRSSRHSLTTCDCARACSV